MFAVNEGDEGVATVSVVGNVAAFGASGHGEDHVVVSYLDDDLTVEFTVTVDFHSVRV